jgi:hypothetical protein
MKNKKELQHYQLEDPVYGKLYYTIMYYDNGTQIKGDYCRSPKAATRSCIARCIEYENKGES